MKYRFIDFTKVVFQDFQNAHYEFQVNFAYIKHPLSDFVQDVFLIHKM
jgi:hypothetical protein